MYRLLHVERWFHDSLTTTSSDALPYIAFAADDAQFLFETSPGISDGESATTMRVVIAQLGHAECECGSCL